MDHRLVFAPEARADLRALYLFLADRAGEAAAMALLQQVETWCAELSDTPDRGVRHYDLFPGLRVLGFERRVALAFHIGLDTVTVDRILFDRAPGTWKPA